MYKSILLSSFFVLCLTITKAQNEVIIKIDSQQTNKSQLFVDVEQEPKFPGGKEELMKFYKETSQFSLCAQKEDGCKTLYYQIVIDTDGSVGHFKIVKGINEEFDAETKRIINQMPKWIPGKNEGEPVKVLMTLDIGYKLSE